MSISDLIVVMKLGIVQQIGQPQEVYDNPVNLFVAKFLGTPPINVFEGRVEGGKLYLDGVETNETEFLPGTTLTLVADKSLYPEGETFTRWYFPSYSSTLIQYTDERAESFTFTICEPPARDRKVTMEAQYAALTSVYYLYTYVPHPVVGGTPSYDAGVDKWKNYFAEVLAWYEGETLLETDHVFEAGKTYTVKIRLEPAPGYYFPPWDFEYLHADNTFSGNSADGILLERGCGTPQSLL